MESTCSPKAKQVTYDMQNPLTPCEYDSMMHFARTASDFMRQEFQKLQEQQKQQQDEAR